MKRTHLNVIAQSMGFDDFDSYLKVRYVDEKHSLEYISGEVELSTDYIASLLDMAGLKKPPKVIPLTVEDAKSLDLLTIAKNLGVSRATAWRWKKKVLADATQTPDAYDEEA